MPVGIVSWAYSRIEMFYQMMKVCVDIPPTLKRCWLPHCRIQDSPVYIYMHGLTGEEWSKKERDRVHVWIGCYPVWFCSFSLSFFPWVEKWSLHSCLDLSLRSFVGRCLTCLQTAFFALSTMFATSWGTNALPRLVQILLPQRTNYVAQEFAHII